MMPPWIAHPDVPPTSIAWRRGELAEVLDGFHRFIHRATPDTRAAFVVRWPEPPEWTGTYARFVERPWS